MEWNGDLQIAEDALLSADLSTLRRCDRLYGMLLHTEDATSGSTLIPDHQSKQLFTVILAQTQ